MIKKALYNLKKGEAGDIHDEYQYMVIQFMLVEDK